MGGKRRNMPSASLLTGIVLVGAMLALFLLGFVWLPHDPASMDLSQRFAAPSASHLLGCDHFGRDILARTIVAARPALAVGLGAVSIGALVGCALGFIAAMCAGAPRAVIMRTVDGLMAFPGLLLAMVLVLVIGRGLVSALVAIAVFMVPTFARLTCQLALEVRDGLAVKAARSYGASTTRIAVVHILPAIAPRLVTQFTACIGSAMLLEASLSFLGLGIQPPTASWGYMLSEAMPYVVSHPQIAFAPGTVLALSVLGFNLLGDGLNDALVRKGRVL